MIVQPAPVELEEKQPIKGIMPDSKEEWWVAKSLLARDIPFDYQYHLFGGKSRRGGAVLDFLVFAPMGIPLPVHGKYWHQSELSGFDKQQLIAIADYFKIGIENIPILWAGDAISPEDVDQFIVKNFVR